MISTIVGQPPSLSFIPTTWNRQPWHFNKSRCAWTSFIPMVPRSFQRIAPCDFARWNYTIWPSLWQPPKKWENLILLEKLSIFLFYVFDSFWELPIYYNPINFIFKPPIWATHDWTPRVSSWGEYERSKGFTQHPGQYVLAIYQLYCKQHIKGFLRYLGGQNTQKSHTVSTTDLICAFWLASAPKWSTDCEPGSSHVRGDWFVEG